MPTFTYTARDMNGNPSNGSVAAASDVEVTQILRREGKYPTSIRQTDAPANTPAPPTGRRGIKLARSDVVQLSNQLAIMVETGVTLTEALDCIAQQAEKPKVKAVVDDLVRC